MGLPSTTAARLAPMPEAPAVPGHRADAADRPSREICRDRAAADAAKDAFLARMSHELKTPLNAIIGFADLLHDELDHADHRVARVEYIQEAGATLLSIIEHILDYAQAEGGRIVLQPRPFDIRSLVEDAMATVGADAQRKSLSLAATVEPSIPALLVGDEARLRQICLTLLDNAIKFSSRGRVSLALRLAVVAHDRVQLRMTVADTGIGIPSDKLGGLFERFSQVDGSLRRPHGGSGLGLAMAKRLVDLMDGSIDVSSTEGRGTTFAVTLWLRVA